MTIISRIFNDVARKLATHSKSLPQIWRDNRIHHRSLPFLLPPQQRLDFFHGPFPQLSCTDLESDALQNLCRVTTVAFGT